MRSYRDYLKEDLERRKKSNPAFGVRAYSRLLGISPGHLSQVMSGRKNLTEEKGEALLGALGWGPEKASNFLGLIRMERTKSEGLREKIRSELSGDQPLPTKPIKLGDFRNMVAWYHSAVFACFGVESMDGTADWISKRLHLSQAKVEESLRVLESMGWIQHQEGQWALVENQVMSRPHVPSQALRQHHDEFLELARKALKRQESEEMDVSGTTLCINPERLPEAKAVINEFRQKLAGLLSEDGKNEQVYRLSVQLFRLDH